MKKRLFAILGAATHLLLGGLAPHLVQAQMEGWYPFKSVAPSDPGVIGMNDWLDKPAGVHGGVRMVGDAFILEKTGAPIKFWGVNLQYGDCMPAKDLGAQMAARFAKYGVNAVRLHKIMEPNWAGFGDPEDSTKFVADKLDNFDHLVAELKKNGLYHGISWVFGHKIRPMDKDKLVAYDEIMAEKGETSRVLVFIAEDVQDLRIRMLVNLLKHRNPYTGLTYAEEPANAFVEFQNEDSIFFFTFQGFNDLTKYPTYKKLFMKRFCDWLRAKYGTQAELEKAWGEKAFNILDFKNESLDNNSIVPNGNPWVASPEGLSQAKLDGTLQRTLDTARFLYEIQLAYYKKFEKAVREAGYQGPLIGSCWTTPAGLPLYYNLSTDYEVGFIDRHNYFGGMKGYAPKPGPFSNASMLSAPGTGLLSMAFLQVLDRPFAASEWSSVFPNRYSLESVSLIAAYGMGLQGWDASYQFTSSARPGFWDIVAGNQNFVVDRIDQMGLYPTLARMIYRGDVRQGGLVGARRVSVNELAQGGPDFLKKEKSESQGDFKEMQTDVPAAAMAAGRVVVEFVKESTPNLIPEMTKHTRGDAIVSDTGQLEWVVAGDKKGWFSINTDGTQAVVGFLPERTISLSQVAFTPMTPFCGLYLTSLDQSKGLESAPACLLTAVARVGNTGMKFNDDETELLEVGKAPLLLEPVRTKIAFTERRPASIEILDHDGRKTGRTLEMKEGVVDIDTGRDQSPYYLITY